MTIKKYENFVLQTGRYAGEYVADVCLDDPEYLRDSLSDNAFDEETKKAVEYTLNITEGDYDD